MRPPQRWPSHVWVVRHGESAGNLAWDAAEAAGHPRIGITTRDVDMPLSPRGEEQSRALGRWFGALAEPPTVILTSPYVRARATAELVASASRLENVAIVPDERLREKEFGVLDGLTKVGIEEHHPEQAEHRRALGKFYHRPPGGESWCDVILRLRSVMDSLAIEYRDERVLVVAHQVVVLCFRYLVERMTEEEILAIDREHKVANCSVTTFEPDATGRLSLREFNFVAPLESAGAEVTRARDKKPKKR
jgi:broad specificity phosphatase PhoE